MAGVNNIVHAINQAGEMPDMPITIELPCVRKSLSICIHLYLSWRVEGSGRVHLFPAETDSVRRLVLTSSVAAVCSDHWERGRHHVFTEQDWNLGASESYLPYHRCCGTAGLVYNVEAAAWNALRASCVQIKSFLGNSQ